MIKGMGRTNHTRHVKHKGDTLVEVSIAIGIFSMVAIATVSVINASTSSSQGMLENTITREEIDAQSEALRFIQSAYVAGGEVDPNATGSATKYARLWTAMTENALDVSEESALNQDIKDIIANYNPTTCSSLYESSSSTNLLKQKAFLINTRAMGSDNINDIIIKPTTDNLGTVFKQATTFPRIVYNQTAGGESIYNQGEDGSNAANADFKITSAEGLFIVPVRDSEGTIIVSGEGSNKIEKISAYVDFYVRSCWFAPSADRPSTISTVVRLYNPDAISINKYERKGIIINYDSGDGATGTMPSQYVLSGSAANLLENRFTKTDYTFMGWLDSDGNRYPATGGIYTAPSGLTQNRTITLTAQWKQYTVKIQPGGGIASITLGSTKCTDATNGCSVSLTYGQSYNLSAEVKDGYIFNGWNKSGSDKTGTIGNVNNVATTYIIGDDTTTITAGWKYRYNLTYYNTNGTTAIKVEPEVTTTAASYSFTINGSLSPTAPAVSQNGNQMVLLGWSENKNGSGTLYNSTGENGASKKITATGPSHANLSLYPVWREIITFTNVPWTDFGNSSYCTINKSTSGIELRGNRSSAVNCGVEFQVGKNDTFELSADLNTSGIFTHPTGLVAVSVGPLVAIITTGGDGLYIYYGYLPLDKSVTLSDRTVATNYTRLDSKTISNGGTATLKLTKYGGVYTMSVNGYEVKIETRENNNNTYNVYKADGSVLDSNRSSNELNNLKVKYTMVHGSHNCSTIFNAKLYNIKMTTANVYN